MEHLGQPRLTRSRSVWSDTQISMSLSGPMPVRQLGAFEFAERDGGTMHIALPGRSGYDDLAMSLCFAVHPKGGLVRRRRRLAYRGSVVSE
jgi:hypothetical protein